MTASGSDNIDAAGGRDCCHALAPAVISEPRDNRDISVWSGSEVLDSPVVNCRSDSALVGMDRTDRLAVPSSHTSAWEAHVSSED